jgi:hypothetical protein
MEVSNGKRDSAAQKDGRVIVNKGSGGKGQEKAEATPLGRVEKV